MEGKKREDHRSRVTKMLIRRAFMDLMRQKPIQSISVKEVCDLAGINRSTFYAHYTDLYDLLDKIEEELIAAFQRALEPMLKEQGTQVNPVAITTEIFRCIKDNADICTVTLGDYGDKSFINRLLMMGRDICIEAYQNYFKRATPKQIEYFYAFVSNGCMGLLRRWMDDGMVSSEEDLAKMAENIMLHGVGFLRSPM